MENEELNQITNLITRSLSAKSERFTDIENLIEEKYLIIMSELSQIKGKLNKLTDNTRKQKRIISKPVIPIGFIIAQIKDGEIINKFKTVTMAARNTYIEPSGIYKCLKKQKRTAGGFEWKIKKL